MNPHLTRPRILGDEEGLFAAFTTRSFAPPDWEEALGVVRETARGEGFAGLALTEQVHGRDVAIVREPGLTAGSDGLVTNRAGLLLGTFAADCALVLLADAEAGVVGNCHAGWRGAVAEIIPETIRRMRSLGAEPGRIKASIGPCISVEAFEVGEEVAERFPARFVVRSSEWPRPHVDLRRFIADQLRESGVAEVGIEVSDACTVSQPEMYYSYRGQNGTTGRQFGLIGLR